MRHAPCLPVTSSKLHAREDRSLPLPLRRFIRRRLLAWYDRNRRDLPWRWRADDPYAQWVAEIMLQQTQVETVRGYYTRFLKRFRTVRSLARADFDEVLKHWEGLGYYRRILHLHRAAQQVVARGGRIPDTVEELRSLPGVGDYTAAAIASIAFGRREAAVDGNVVRVLSRVLGGCDATPALSRGRIRDAAQALIPRARPGEFNQAWMDLGSLICTPRAPKCPQCPLQPVCVAANNGSAIPTGLTPRRPPRTVTLAVGIFVNRNRLWVRRRPLGGLWSGLWEFPSVEIRLSKGGAEAVRRLASELGLMLADGPVHVGEVRHQLTHRSMVFHVYTGRVRPSAKGTTGGGFHRWVTPAELQSLAVSTAHRRVFEKFEVRSSKFEELAQ